MVTYKEQVRNIWKRYREDVSTSPVDLKDVAAWAIDNKLWHPRPIDLHASLAGDLADALREEKRVDEKGREYRANVPVRTKPKDGPPLFVWADIDDAPHTHVVKSVQQERRSIASDCYALAMKADHYNDAHPDREPIQVDFNFEEDVEEAKIARGLLDDGTEEAA
jgi:hypothetical protein